MTNSFSVSVFAPAKINLTLHVTGRRTDGYHLLDSLVAFADVGDELDLQPGNGLAMTAEGPEAAAVPTDMGNLVLKVATLFPDIAGLRVLLTKALPVASGIGGGSADAAAAFRGLMSLRMGGAVARDLYDPARVPDAAALVALGADIPMCLLSDCTRARGIGDELLPARDLPPLHAVLVNPRRAVSTPAVFAALAQRENPPMPAVLPRFAGAQDLLNWLAMQRNDLEPPARQVEPLIDKVLTELSMHSDCRLARMSGSGATCFALCQSSVAAERLAADMRRAHPNWWIVATGLGNQSSRALPRVS